jgi:hypothetical protein
MLHVHGSAARPSSRTELPIPPALEDLVMELLAKKADERPQTADDVATRLGQINVEPRWTAERAGQWWDLHYPRG